MTRLTEQLIEMGQLFTLCSSFMLSGLPPPVFFLISMTIAEICLKEKRLQEVQLLVEIIPL